MKLKYAIPCLIFLGLMLGSVDGSQQSESSKSRSSGQQEKKKQRERGSRKRTRKQDSNRNQSKDSVADKKKKTGNKKPEAGKKSVDKKSDNLTLKELFPEKSPFGPTASRTSFSQDGRYAAFLYRPYAERRHGSDLYVYDFQKDELKRLTSVSVMAPFQASTRKVMEDRIAKAKKATAGKNKEPKSRQNENRSAAKNTRKQAGRKKDQQSDESKKLGDTVSDKDADDTKAPRYSGISSYSWHPDRHEILFTSGGEIYRIGIDGSGPERLTRTRGAERSVRYLPDGKGYMFMRDDKLFRVREGISIIEQIDPALGSEESLSSYRLSPDGRLLAIQTRKGKSPFSSERKIKIVNYRGRFAEVREFNRVVSDDPVVEQTVNVYFYDLSKHDNEEAQLIPVFTTKINSPRDAVSSPEWSLDSKQITFATFHFDDENVAIYTATFPADQPDVKKNPDGKPAEAQPGSAKGEKKEATDRKEESNGKSDDKAKTQLARLQYRFLHFGGPNTPRMISPRFLSQPNKILFVSEQTGFRHLHVLDTTYQTVAPLTQGNYEVYLEAVSRDRRYALVTSTKFGPSRTMAFSIDVESGVMNPLTEVKGNYSSVAISQDGTRMIGNYSTFGKLTELVRVDTRSKNKPFKVLTDSHSPKAREITRAVPEFFNYKNRHGHLLHGTVFKPDGWKKTDKRPCLIYVYGGPLGTRHSVVDGSYRSDSYFFAWYMAKVHGYVTVTIDPRGQSGYGALFEKSNFQQVGKPQVEDLVDGTKFLIKNYGVDAKKIGLHGWSFGGFQTQMCLYTEPDVFAAGIAGAGPTEWENYNKWYASGTIDRSRPGQVDQKKYSLLPLAKNLKARLLLVHGMEDSNVLYQDTVRVYRELIKAGKETLVELFLDPTGGHGLGGDVKRLAKYRKYEEFLVRTLGSLKKK